MTLKAEQETTATQSAGDALAYVYTAQPKHVRRMERDDRFTRRSGDGVTWGNYVIAAALYDPLKGVKRRARVMSAAELAANAERLARAREAKGAQG